MVRRFLHICVRASLVMPAVALLCGLACPTAVAKSFLIKSVKIDARLLPDGSMEVCESRTYGFSGSFSFAYRDFPADARVSFKNFRVSENTIPYKQSDSEEPGTYKVSRNNGRIKVTWFYSAANESKTFELRYRALNTIKRYEDAAVLYYKFISEEWTSPQRYVTVTLKPPKRLIKGNINEWLHGPLWAESQIAEDGTIKAFCERLPIRTYLEIRALYPPDAFPETQQLPGRVRARIMAEEARWALEANRQREAAAENVEARKRRRKLGEGIGIGLSAAGLVAWWFIFRAYHRKPALPRFLEMNSEIPDRTPPALLSYLLSNRTVSGPALIGTMLDLARRGFINLREEMVEKKSIWGGMKRENEYHWDVNRTYWRENASQLRGYENALIEFIFDDLAEGKDSISIEQIKKERRAFIGFFKEWKKDVESVGKDKGWFDQRSIRGMYYSVVLGIGMVGLAIPLIIFFGPWPLVLGGAGVIVMILSFFIQHRTTEGETRARHWKAVEKYLKAYEFRNADHESLLAQISDYLVYGVVLGLSTKFYKEIATYIPEGTHVTYVPWYVYHGAATEGFSPAAFGEAFSSMVATTTSAMSTAAGTGGGASVGGGGGASSGGGGAG